jgi:hypothetical protein
MRHKRLATAIWFCSTPQVSVFYAVKKVCKHNLVIWRQKSSLPRLRAVFLAGYFRHGTYRWLAGCQHAAAAFLFPRFLHKNLGARRATGDATKNGKKGPHAAKPITHRIYILFVFVLTHFSVGFSSLGVGALEFSIITLSLLDFCSGDKIAAILGVVPEERIF